MSKFIKHLFYFIAPLLILMVCTDLWLRNINSLYKEKYEGVLKNKKIQILILGNSHANYGVDPQCFDLPAFNLANVAQSIYFDKRITQKVISQLPNVRYVLISLDYHSFYFSSQDIRDPWSYYANGVKYKNKNYTLETFSPALFGYTPQVTLALLRKKIYYALKYPSEKIIDFDVEEGVNVKDSIRNGFIGYSGTNKAVLSRDAYIKRAHDLTFPDEIEKLDVVNDLSDFIVYLKKKNIIPILFTTPTYHEFNVFLDPQILEENKKSIAYFKKKYGIEYWNYMDNTMFKKEDFYNCDHMNTKGAQKFSKILNALLMEKDAQMSNRHSFTTRGLKE